MQDLLLLLQGLEVELHHPAHAAAPRAWTRCSIPSSTRSADPAAPTTEKTVLGFLASLSEHPPVVSEGFEVALLAPKSPC
jgi:hypothetical protein